MTGEAWVKRWLMGRVFAFCCAVVISSLALFGADSDEDGAIARFESLIKAGEYADAQSSLEAYTKVHPDSWQALYQLGYVDFRLHRIRESLTALSKSLVLNDRFSEAHKVLAYDLNIVGRRDLAEAELQKAIALDPKSAECYYELGRIYYDEGSYTKAVRELEQAAALNPSFVKVHHNLGLAYAAVGENEKAVREFEEGLRLNTQQSKPSAWPLIDYASYWNLQNKFEKSKELLLEAIRIDDSWDQEFDELSKAYRGLGQTDLAIENLQRAIALSPRKPEYHYALARLYSQAHRPSDAKQQLAEYEKVRPKTTAQ